jgi:release factor glutamine methyltransferase
MVARRVMMSNGMRSGRRANIRPNRFQSQDKALFSTRQFSTTANHEEQLETMTGWTVQETIEKSTSFLERANAPEPESSVTHLLAHALGLSWETGFVQLRHVSSDDELSKRILSNKESSLFSEMLHRRVKQEPLQYILGKWAFLDFMFMIRPPLLCPRPETEELVLKAANDATRMSSGENTLQILDVGCGTGAIGVSLAAMLPETTQVVAIDVEPIAVSTSNDNARAILGSDCNRYQAVLCGAKDFVNEGASFDLIVSNPPYIPKHDMITLSDDVVKFESAQALCGGTDGMDVIREIILQAPHWSRPGGIIWMEVDPTHPKLLQEWLDSEVTLGVELDSVCQDLYGRDRFVKLIVK